MPFALQYLTTGSGRAELIAHKNIGQAFFPPSVAAGEPDAWGLDRVVRERKALVIEQPPSMSPPLPGGVWPEPTTQLVAIPMTARGHESDLLGIFVVGVSPRLRLDEPYMDFLKLVAAHLAGTAWTLQSVAEEARATKIRIQLINDLEETKLELEAQVQQKELLLNEVNHRVKNSLQIVSGILQLQLRDMHGPAADAMRNASSRVLAIATVHERLYKGQNVVNVELDRFLVDLCRLVEHPTRLTAQERGFIQSSIESADEEERRKARTRRYITWGSIAAAVVLAIVAGVAVSWFLQARESERQANAARDAATQSESRAQKARSRSAL